MAEELEGMTLTRRGVWLVDGVVVPGDGLRLCVLLLRGFVAVAVAY